MQVVRAKTAGFCLGVSLALKRLDREVERPTRDNGPKRLFTFGPIIHNPLVMRRYAERGVLCADDPAALRPGDRVLIRAHGIPREIEAQLRQTGAIVSDATCPKVKRAQIAIARMHARGGALLLFGERNHPEVRGLLSYAGEGALVFGDLAELETLDLDPGRSYFLAAQTTQERALYQEAAKTLQRRLARPVKSLDTICDATRERQQEVINLCATVDAMVVVGGFNSGNTRRLAEVAEAHGVPALHVEQPGDITPEKRHDFFRGIAQIGLTAGASTPDEHIEAMQRFLERLPLAT